MRWREKVIEPLFESRTDQTIAYQLAEKLGFGKKLVKSNKLVAAKGGMMEPEPEALLREINRSNWTIGYTRQSPERLKAQWSVLSLSSQRCASGLSAPGRRRGSVEGQVLPAGPRAACGCTGAGP